MKPQLKKRSDTIPVAKFAPNCSSVFGGTPCNLSHRRSVPPTVATSVPNAMLLFDGVREGVRVCVKVVSNSVTLDRRSVQAFSRG